APSWPSSTAWGRRHSGSSNPRSPSTVSTSVRAEARGRATDRKDAPMQPQAPHSGFQGWQRLVGSWATEATHRLLPGPAVSGNATYEWLEDQRFLIQRVHYDHPDLPDAVTVTGTIDGKPLMHYFDVRGVHRVFDADFIADTWRFWN